MKFDLVHDTQGIFRTVVKCMSRPGTIAHIGAKSELLDLETAMSRHMLSLLFVLLDREVTFAVLDEEGEKMTSLINQLTYAKSTSPEWADYLIVTAKAGQKVLQSGFGKAKIGTLVDPHKAATVILEVEEMTAQGDLVLRGPGIQYEHYLGIQGHSNWLDIREKKNSEFPLGIDMILIDRQGNMVCLPRTTTITRQVIQ